MLKPDHARYLERVRRGVGRLRVEYAGQGGAPAALVGRAAHGDAGADLIAISLMGAYVALRLTEDPRLEAAFAAAKVERSVLIRFIEQARSGMPDAMLPFVRRDADLAYAVMMSRSCDAWLMRGDQTRVEAGHFVYRCVERGRAALRYVDRCGGQSGSEPVLLEPSRVDCLLSRVSELPRPIACFVAADAAEHGLRIECARELRALLTGRPGDLRGPDRGVISLVSRSAVRLLAEVGFHDEASGFAIADLPVERLMALHAASLDETWLLIEHPQFCALGPLPDLFSPGSRMPVRLEPSLLLLDHLGGAELETISLPRALAVDLLARFDWLAAPHPVAWRQVVEAVA